MWPPCPLAAVIVSEVRFLRESLSDVLRHTPGWIVRDHCATLAHAVAVTQEQRPDIVLLDAAFPSGKQAATRLSAANPCGNVVALAVVETEASILGWVEAGARGYVPNTASVADLIGLIGQIVRGEQTCSSRIAGGLMRRLADSGVSAVPTPSDLTGREIEILHLVGGGLSNKDIARRLGVSLGTTKSHVHNLLTKLRVSRRAEVMMWLRTQPGADSPAARETCIF